jgi:hypothetical protein
MLSLFSFSRFSAPQLAFSKTRSALQRALTKSTAIITMALSIIMSAATICFSIASYATDTLNCPAGILRASDFLKEQGSLATRGELLEISLANSSGSAKLHGGSISYTVAVNKDPALNLYGVDAILDKSGGHLAGDRFLLKYSRISQNTPWDIGKPGDAIFEIVTDSLRTQTMRFILSNEAFEILKSYGVSTHVLLDYGTIMPAIESAVADKKMQKDDEIAAGLTYACFLTHD